MNTFFVFASMVVWGGCLFCARGGGGGGEERGGARFFLLVFWCLFTSSSTSSSGKARSCRSEGFAVGQRSVRVGSVACGWAVECGSSSKQCSDYRASVEKCSLSAERVGQQSGGRGSRFSGGAGHGCVAGRCGMVRGRVWVAFGGRGAGLHGGNGGLFVFLRAGGPVWRGGSGAFLGRGRAQRARRVMLRAVGALFVALTGWFGILSGHVFVAGFVAFGCVASNMMGGVCMHDGALPMRGKSSGALKEKQRCCSRRHKRLESNRGCRPLPRSRRASSEAV